MDELWAIPPSTAARDDGSVSIAKGSFNYTPETWNDVTILVQLNTVTDAPQADGILQVRLGFSLSHSLSSVPVPVGAPLCSHRRPRTAFCRCGCCGWVWCFLEWWRWWVWENLTLC